MTRTQMIAPCGINCGVCIGYLREKNRCSGCNALKGEKVSHCDVCIIKNCRNKKRFCFECKEFPCLRMRKLDKRYKDRYRTSLINNLKEIEQIGIREFTNEDNQKWLCKKCGNVISIHRKVCSKCGKEYEVALNFNDEKVK